MVWFRRIKKFEEMLIEEINGLGIKNLQVKALNLLNGFYVNLEYPLPNGQSVRLLEDNNVYWGNQIEIFPYLQRDLPGCLTGPSVSVPQK